MRRIAHHRARALACLLACAALLGGCRARHEVAVELQADGSGVFAVVSALDAEARRLLGAGAHAGAAGGAGGTTNAGQAGNPDDGKDAHSGASGAGAGRPPPPVATNDGIVEEPWQRGDLEGTRSSLRFDDLGELAEVLNGGFGTDATPRPASVSRDGRTVTIVVDTRPAVREFVDALGAGDEPGDEPATEAGDEGGDARAADTGAPNTATSSTASAGAGTPSTAPPPPGAEPARSLLDEVTRALDLHLALRVEGRVLDHNGERGADGSVVWPLLPVPAEKSRARVLLHPGDRSATATAGAGSAARDGADRASADAAGSRGGPDGSSAAGPRATPRALAIALAVLGAAGAVVAARRRRDRGNGWKTLP